MGNLGVMGEWKDRAQHDRGFLFLETILIIGLWNVSSHVQIRLNFYWSCFTAISKLVSFIVVFKMKRWSWFEIFLYFEGSWTERRIQRLLCCRCKLQCNRI